MNIQDATKLAMEKDLYIIRENDYPFNKFARIKPTCSSDCCIICPTSYWEEEEGKKITPGKRWQPNAEDLIADDWVVTELYPDETEVKDNKSSVGTKEEFYVVKLRHRNFEYYLVDLKMTISLDKSSAMIFFDHDLSLDYATKVENNYCKIMNHSVLGYTEKCFNIYAFNNLS